MMLNLYIFLLKKTKESDGPPIIFLFNIIVPSSLDIIFHSLTLRQGNDLLAAGLLY